MFFGKVPIMLKSEFCNLYQESRNSPLELLGECPFDQGGYFVVNGSEKVVVA